MDMFDERRIALGISPMGGDSSSQDWVSKFDARRKELDQLLNPHVPEQLPFLNPSQPEISNLSAGPRLTLSPSFPQAMPSHTPYQAPPQEQNPIVGENLFLQNALPIRQNDNPIIAGLKGTGNILASTAAAPFELYNKALLQGGSLLSGNGIRNDLPKNTSFTEDFLKPALSQSGQNSLSSFQQNHPVLGGMATMAMDTVTNPLTFIGGGTIAKALKAPNQIEMAGKNLGKIDLTNFDPNNLKRAPIDPTYQPGVISKPLGPLRVKTPEQIALGKLQQGTETAQNFIQHNDVLAPYPPGTTVEQAFADIQKNTGVNLPKLTSNLENALKQPQGLTERFPVGSGRLARVAGVKPGPSDVRFSWPELKNRDIVQPQLPPGPGLKRPQIPIAEPSLSKNQYVDTKPIEINIGKNDKTTSTDIRQAYVGKMNSQIVTGNQLRDTIQKLAPKEQQGIQLFIDSGGDMKHLQDMASNPDTVLDSFIPNTKTTYREAYNQALNLSPEAQKAAQMAQQYYKESGQYALDMGSTRSVLENYASRMWKQPPAGTIKTEVRTPGLNPFTSHSKERIYNTIGEGIINGKEPATLNAGDLLSIHNQEMARANTNRALAKSLQDNGLGTYQFNKPQQGFTAIDSLSRDIPTTHEGNPAIIHQNFVIPDGIAKGLKAITDPNYIAKVDSLRHLQAYQGLVKTVDLSFSLFHHITLAAEALYNSHGGIDFIKNWDKMSKLGSDSFNASEKWGAEHGLMTTKIDDNYDVVRQLAGKEGIINRAWNSNNLLAKTAAALPKGAAELANKNTEFLFGKIQRWLKVIDFQNKASEYVGKNPNMSNIEVTKGLRQIASQVNDAYGGLNWKAMGMTPSVQALSRLGLLAPDWTFSSARMLGKAFIKGPGGNAARSEFAVALIGGGILTEGLNKLLTGHYTNQNSKGHELEVQVQPGVYISFFRSGIGDVTKWSANMLNQGVLGGSVNTIQGKMSPLVKTLVGQLSNKQPTGAPITNTKNTPLQNDLARIKSAGETLLPIPMGVPNIQRYAKGGEVTPLGGALVGTGAARYSQTKQLNPFANPKSAYAGNWLDNLVNPADESSNNLIDKISAQEKAQSQNTTLINQGLSKALNTGGSTANIFKQYNVPVNKQAQLLKDAKDRIAENKLSPLAQKFQGLSKVGQTQLLNGLSPSDRSTLLSEPGLKRK